VADIFISYSKKHRPLTERIAALLERQQVAGPDGKPLPLTVWWDTGLKSGDSFHREIAREIDAARAVVVIWSEGAVASDWVYAEAQRGATQRKLVPLRDPSLEFNRIPLPYSAFHIDAADNDDAIIASVMARLGGAPSEDASAFGAEKNWLIDPKAEPPLERVARTSPALLLQARHRVVPFVDIGGRHADLIDWANGRGRYPPQASAGRVIHGPGGLGKTRMLIEAVETLNNDGWLAGFMNRDTLGHAKRGPQLEELVRNGRDARGLFLALDYAEGRSDEIKTLSRLLLQRERAGGAPARLVLLSRAAGDWWSELWRGDESVPLVFGVAEEKMDEERLGDIPTGDARFGLWKQAAAALKPYLVRAGHAEAAARDPDGPPDAALATRLLRLRQDPDYARPLAIQIEALLWLRGASPGAQERGIAPMLDHIVELERAHWAKITENVSKTALDRGVAQITAIQGVESRASAIKLLQADGEFFGPRTAEAASSVAAEIAKLYGERANPDDTAAETTGQERIGALEPDLIGEHHLAGIADAGLLNGCLEWTSSEPEGTREKRRRDLLTVLQRATFPEHGAKVRLAEKALIELVRPYLELLAADIVAVIAETPGSLEAVVTTLLNDAGYEALMAIDAALPMQSLALMDLSLAVAQRLATLMRSMIEALDAASETSDEQHQAILSEFAARVSNLGVRFSNLGRREEALAASQEAVDIYRRLAQARPDAFLPDLASSLNNIGADLSDLGRREEALAASQEAVDIRRRLAQVRPDAFLPDLAASLNNLGIRLSSLGQREEALAATQEAVDIYRRLAQARPDAFLPELASSLNNLGIRLSDLGQREEALAASQEAVDIRRRLAQARPDAFLPNLATSVSVLSDALAALDRHADAASAASEALETLAPFVERYPQTYGGLGRTIAADVIKYSKAAGVEPDVALLGRIAHALGLDAPAGEDPAIAALRAKIGAILEAAERTGTLDEAALAELPPELAKQIRTAWANKPG